MAAKSPTPAPIDAVVRALATLRCQDKATRDTVLVALGWPAVAKEVREQNPIRSLIAAPEIPKPPARTPPLPERRPPLHSTLTVLGTPQTDEPDWLKNEDPLPLPDPASAVPLYAKPIKPLFPPLITRAILTRLTAVPAPVGEVDVERLVDTVARGKPVTKLPRRPVLTLAKGLDLLIDHGAGMDPFSADIARLVDDLPLAVGRDRLTIRVFRGCPGRGVMNLATAAAGPYQPPPTGTPVLAVTDLGIAEQRRHNIPIPSDEWLTFAAALRSRGSPLAVLTPWSRNRVPAALRRGLMLITWDRRTGARLNDRSRPEAAAGEDGAGATRLAQLASIAGRIDPQFLRVLRLELAPELGTEAEADLWSSGLAQSATVTGIVLKPETQQRLQAKLAEGDLLTKVWEILFQLRTKQLWADRDLFSERNWLVALEELTYWGLKGLDGDAETRAAAEKRLAQILKTMLQAAPGSEREGDALIWTRNAERRLPAAIQALQPMQDLLKGALLRGCDVTSAVDRGDVPRYLQRRHQKSTPIWLTLVEGGLEAGLDPFPDAHRIEAIALKSLMLRLSWRAADGQLLERALQLNPPRRAFLESDGDEIEIAAPDGTRVRLTRRRPTLLINVPPPPDIFVDREPELQSALDALLLQQQLKSSTQADRPARVFVSYSRFNDELIGELKSVLKRLQDNGLIDVWLWDDKDLSPAEGWPARIDKELKKAELILLMVSPEWLASKWSGREMQAALLRSAEGSALVIPIIAEPCDWRSTLLAKIQVLPRDGRALGDADATTRTMRWLELAGELEQAISEWRETNRRRQAATQGPHVVAINGLAGIGKFTLTRRLVHEPALRERYPDGILWLTEDGQGYPRQWLHEYCAAVGVPATFSRDESVDKDKFHALFAGRRVLFIADQRTASDILPTLIEQAGPGCTVLVLARDPPFPAPWPLISLAPLPGDVAREVLSAFHAPVDLPAELIDFTACNPLLLRLAAAGATVVEPAPLKIAQEASVKSDPDFGEEGRKASALVAGMWLGGLPAPLRSELRRLIKAHPSATRFAEDAASGDAAVRTELIRLGLLEDVTPLVRLHPMVRAAIGGIPEDRDHPDRDVDAPWCPEMVVIPVGEFMMGSPESDKEGYSDERPQHRVTIGYRFCIGRYPVTFDEYEYFCAATEREKPVDQGWGRGKRPVINVNWRDAVDYCEWLAKEMGKPYRLPSEAEWEHACRAGTTTRYFFGDEITEKDANYGGVIAKTTEVGFFAPNKWGIFDMHGNVWEWVEDNWHGDYSGAPGNGAAWVDGAIQSPDNRLRVVRGGSWNVSPRVCRCASRYSVRPDYLHFNIGFRVARPLK